MTETRHKTYRLREETLAKIDELGRMWSQASPIGAAKVLDECVKRVHEQETRRQEKRR